MITWYSKISSKLKMKLHTFLLLWGLLFLRPSACGLRQCRDTPSPPPHGCRPCGPCGVRAWEMPLPVLPFGFFRVASYFLGCRELGRWKSIVGKRGGRVVWRLPRAVLCGRETSGVMETAALPCALLLDAMGKCLTWFPRVPCSSAWGQITRPEWGKGSGVSEVRGCRRRPGLARYPWYSYIRTVVY